MTSKEALDKLVRKYCVSETDEDDKEAEDLYNLIKKDLEVLEILKKHLLCVCNCEDEKPNEHIEAYSGKSDAWGYYKFSNWNIDCSADFRIVKEWLEK